MGEILNNIFQINIRAVDKIKGNRIEEKKDEETLVTLRVTLPSIEQFAATIHKPERYSRLQRKN